FIIPSDNMSSKVLNDAIFSACQAVFNGEFAKVRKSRVICRILDPHWKRIKHSLPPQTTQAEAVTILRGLLKDNKFGDNGDKVDEKRAASESMKQVRTLTS